LNSEGIQGVGRRGKRANACDCHDPATPAPASPAPPGSVVVVSTTRDPATPYQAGVDLARQLDAPLITYDGTQHTVVFNGEACVDDAVIRYLVDAEVPGDLTC
jgi:hypothetical protein